MDIPVISKLWSRVKQPRTPYTRYGSLGYDGSVPPDRTTEGFLKAYGEIGWLYAVVFRIALGCSEVEWTLFDTRSNDKPKQVFKHPVLTLLNQVNPFLTSPEFIALNTIYMELIGECFWILNYNRRGEPTEIWLPYPHKMSVVPDKKNYIKGYVYGEGENAIPFNPREVIHFKYPSPLNQYRGLGPAKSIAVDLDAEIYSGQWNRNFFYNSARPDGVIEFDYNLAEEQFERLRKEWKERYRGVSKAHQISLLEGGGKFRQIQNTIKDMDFPNLKLRNRDAILGVYSMPLSVMGITENVNKANAEAGEYIFARWIVKPRLMWMCAKMQEQLITKFKDTESLKLGFKEVVPETIEQRKAQAESGMKNGYLTINEARSIQGFDPIPNGDVLLVPLNLVPTPITGKIQPPAKPAAPAKALSEEYKENYWLQYALKTEQQEGVFQRVCLSVFKWQRDLVLEHFKVNSSILEDLQDDQTATKFLPVLSLVYNTNYDDAIKLVDALDAEWVAERSAILALIINKTTIEALKAELTIGYQLGESIPKLTKRLSGYFTGEKAHYRAETIARTEVIAVSNEAALRRYSKEGVERSEFYPAPDACDECAAKAGVYPTKDLHGVIPVHPRCRCTVLPVVE